MSAVALTTVAPIGFRDGPAFVTCETGCGMETVRRHIYPPSWGTWKLRNLRVSLGLSLRDAAMLLGIEPVEVSDLECGKASTDWRIVEALLRGAAK